jgi:hypothetical protein
MSEEKVAALIRAHVQRHPDLEILDVYKLLHQAAFGPGHAIQNQRAAREWLERESELYVPDASEALVENIHPDGAVVRIHLRPYLAAHGRLNDLLRGFIESSKAIVGDPDSLAAWWATFQELGGGGTLGKRFDPRVIALEGRTRAAEHWSAAQHSPTYERTYRPAYRVLGRAQAEGVLNAQNLPFNPV